MAALIIRIEESREEEHCGHEMVGFSIQSAIDGELQIGDTLPGIRAMIERSVKDTIDKAFGRPVGLSIESMADAHKQAFMN